MLLELYLSGHAEVPGDLLELLSIPKLREVQRYCSKFVLRQRALVSLILTAPRHGYIHARQHREFQPVHLQPTHADLQSIRDSVNPGSKVPKALRKMIRIFDERKHVSAHLFTSPDRWHMFYFTLQDTDERENHWEHGAHVHFVNYLWPNIDPEVVWKSFADRKSLHPGVHIRFLSAARELGRDP